MLASFGVIIKNDILELFEPEGILNIHPSLLPQYRGPSPIETAILNGDTEFSVSIMKLTSGMDAGPIYYQTTLSNLPLDKATIYQELATTGAQWLVDNLEHLPQPIPQIDADATYTQKLDKSMSLFDPKAESSATILRKIVAFQAFPKTKFNFFGKTCILIKAHISVAAETPLSIKCQDGKFIIIDELQPEGRNPMSAKAFLNGYAK